MQEWIETGALGALGLIALMLALALVRMRSQTSRELAQARADTARLRARIDEIERRIATPRFRDGAGATAPATDAARVDAGFVITAVGEHADQTEVAPVVDRALFADLVLRETVVRAASLAHGVRRALAPETRNRIRFEVRREIRRARKQRKADLKEARRDWRSRQRAELSDDEDAA